MEFFILFPAKQDTKPVFQHFMEPVTVQFSKFIFFQLFPPASKPFIPKMARVVIKHHIKHRVIERIGFRSPFASCWAFVHLDHLYPTASLLPFGSWTLIIFPRISQWEPLLGIDLFKQIDIKLMF